MSYKDIKEVKEAFSDIETNKFLKKSFELLKILQSKRNINNIEEVRPCYVLGKK